MPWCLTVIDGADLKKIFPLPAEGKVVIGKNRLFSHITFNDFYLEKAHCSLEIRETGIIVCDTSAERGIFVNGKKVVGRIKLDPDDVLRVGNTFLRLDPYNGAAEDVGSSRSEERPAMPLFSLDRLGSLSGHSLGHYELGLLQGTGRHGVVFRAQDRNSDRTVALKVLDPHFPNSQEELKKFAHVIKSRAALTDHPALVRWVGTGKTGPYVWIAQEWIEGENLSSIFTQPESGRWCWRNAWRLAWDVAHALDHLRQRQVAHRNITPANLLITHEGKVKLNDVYFLEAIEGSRLHEQQREQKWLAELPYMPPELLDEDNFVDPHVADIYSLGVLAYIRLSSGHPPLAGKDPGETIELIRAGITDKHRRRSMNAPTRFLDIIFKMLARKQEDRYQTPAELIADLSPFDEK